MTSRGFYHEGMRKLQERAGARQLATVLERGARHDELTPDEVSVVAASEFFFIASSFGDRPDVSFKAGPRGFVSVPSPSLIEFPDYDGNYMFRTLGNIVENPHVQLLFIAFDGASKRLRINGSATIDHSADAVAGHAGAKAMVRVHCLDVFPNCPRYIPDLGGGLSSADLPREGAKQPMPFWKTLPFIAPNLPDDDIHRVEALRQAEGHQRK